ncbi:hypothetical protein TREMEDRAFT_69735 [Tremella mesenterica DSM 1558]|uniref:uncharacterized protein n=1 Tax=Tremella mesenterica (strain ATCC 24925 / CBS 8224 / DSM 1558 / NBRC 9311 / NRRL Y-6157 / RJB 2259-6 / UBC 559-6) TaxID=578456 RepID=UPI0003F49351|nr:uncharacterized protein TREMEDRAFT_69735 [Tremella mesenterica DSM 1558]EIW67205.1 hypothetical protein TREMEDRAFT_69735 [Tremella mesenterica DSM 1558]
MEDPMALAVQYKNQHPSESYQSVADRFKVPRTTLNDRHRAIHLPHPINAPRRLSVEQENQLELAESVCEETLGLNWVGRFVDRHKEVLTSRFYTYQELGRLKADKPETRRAFYTLVKDVYDTGLYAPSCIFNMDEVPFSLSYERKVRRIGPRDHPRNGQAIPASSEHITSIACIGIDSAPVPPVIIYKGACVQQNWTSVSEKDIRQLAVTTDSGWINSYIMVKWLEDVFDPYTRDIAQGRRRLLFIDGAEPHTKVNFLEACWARNIVCIIFPSNMTDKFQPLDVDFFNILKAHYFERLSKYQFGASDSSAAKGMFWGWHQQAWRETATSRQMRGAWRKAGLWPLDRNVMGAQDEGVLRTPPPRDLAEDPLTPHTIHILRANNCGMRHGEINKDKAIEKLEKKCEQLMAEIAMLKRELADVYAAQALDKATRGSKKKQRYPDGGFFDPLYQEEHAEELEARKNQEEEARKKKRQRTGHKTNLRAPNPSPTPTPGPSNSV